MKRTLLIALAMIAMIFLTVPGAFGQDATAPTQPTKTYVVSADQLTPGQIAQLEAGETLGNLEVVGKYAGVGKEIGEGVSEALGALNEETQKFGDTKVGHFTMAMIAWKIMGDDILMVASNMIGYFVGIPFLFSMLALIAWSYHSRCIPHRVLIEKGQGFFSTKKYEVREPTDGKDSGWDASEWAVAHFVVMIVVFLVSAWMIFA